MKLYINTDLEGVTSTYTMEMMTEADPLYEYAYEQLASDINAAVEGAFQGGATFVATNDGHYKANGLKEKLLDKRVHFDKHNPNKGYLTSLGEGYDAFISIGCHAMAGTLNAFLDHTMSSQSWFNYSINGKNVGEIGIWAAIGSHFNIPMIMISGDEAACSEARNFLGDIKTVAVKKGIGRNKVELYDPDLSRKKIQQAVKEAVEDFLGGKVYSLYKPSLPAEVILTYYRSDYCDSHYARSNKVERIDSRSVRSVVNSYLDLLI